jgi:hypothetical protein
VYDIVHELATIDPDLLPAVFDLVGTEDSGEAFDFDDTISPLAMADGPNRCIACWRSDRILGSSRQLIASCAPKRRTD